jgi:hypothetical protein
MVKKKSIFTSNSMATLTYTYPKGQPQIFKEGELISITDRPKIGKISKWENGWFLGDKSITVDGLQMGLYELRHMEPSPPLGVLTEAEQLKAEKENSKAISSYYNDKREAGSGGKRSRRRSRKSRKSKK